MVMVLIMTGIIAMTLLAKCEHLPKFMCILYNTCHSPDPWGKVNYISTWNNFSAFYIFQSLYQKLTAVTEVELEQDGSISFQPVWKMHKWKRNKPDKTCRAILSRNLTLGFLFACLFLLPYLSVLSLVCSSSGFCNQLLPSEPG